MTNAFAKDAARRMRKELAELEADQAKATCWGAAVGERGKRIDALRRELARQPDTPNETGTSVDIAADVIRGLRQAVECEKSDTSAEAVERLIAPIRDHLERAEEENARLQYIKATIRVNAMRNGATEDEILQMQTGGMSFIQWMVERLDYSTLATERDALQAKLDEAVGALDAIATYRKQCHQYDADIGHALRDFDIEDVRLMEWQARTTLAKLKGETDE